MRSKSTHTLLILFFVLILFPALCLSQQDTLITVASFEGDYLKFQAILYDSCPYGLMGEVHGVTVQNDTVITFEQSGHWEPYYHRELLTDSTTHPLLDFQVVEAIRADSQLLSDPDGHSYFKLFIPLNRYYWYEEAHLGLRVNSQTGEEECGYLRSDETFPAFRGTAAYSKILMDQIYDDPANFLLGTFELSESYFQNIVFNPYQHWYYDGEVIDSVFTPIPHGVATVNDTLYWIGYDSLMSRYQIRNRPLGEPESAVDTFHTFESGVTISKFNGVKLCFYDNFNSFCWLQTDSLGQQQIGWWFDDEFGTIPTTNVQDLILYQEMYPSSVAIYWSDACADSIYLKRYHPYYYWTDVPESTIIPDNYPIARCWPNPFNSTINLQVITNEPALLGLRIYNLLGRMVYEQTASSRSARFHSSWSAMDQSSGTYYVQLMRNGKRLATKKIVLVK